MRYTLWFTAGFSLASFLFAYLLSGWQLWAVGFLLLILSVLGMIVWKTVDFRRIAVVSILGVAIGLLWCSGYSAIRFDPIRPLHATDRDLTLTVSDYHAKEDNGSYISCTARIGNQEYPVLLYLYEGLDLKPGDQIKGNFYLRYTATGEQADPTYHRSEGKFLLLTPNGEVTVSDGEWNWRYIAVDIRHQMLQMIQAAFPEDTQAFAMALLLGETDDLSYETDTALKISGIRHVVAVSGLHVSILYSLVYLISLHNRKLLALLGIPCLLLFGAVAGFSPSVTRACIVQLIMILSQLLKKEYDPPTSLAVAVLVILAMNPLTIASVGFQLSVASVAGILTLYQRIHDRIMDIAWLGSGKGNGIGAKLTRYVVSSISVSVSATLFTTPLCAYYFGMVSLISLVTNLVCLWVITYVFCGIIAVCVTSLLYIPAAAWLGWLLSWPIRVVLWIADLLSRIPLAYVSTQNPGVVLWLIVSYAFLIVFLLHKWKIPGNPAYYSAILLLIVILATWVRPMTEDYRVTVLDVGQGQCILLQSEGRTVMVDCGSEYPQAAADTAAAYLADVGVSKLDALIITHYDKDHAGGARYLMSRVFVKKLILPDATDGGEILRAMLDAPHGQTVTADHDITLSWTDTNVSILTPGSGKTGNESSLCILFQKENCDILITGDTDKLGELRLANKYPLPDLEYLVVGHHGSKHSTERIFLEATNPDVALISAGEDNRYGHPAQEVLQLLESLNISVRRTDLEGTIIIRG